jgi:hypothetical protein
MSAIQKLIDVVEHLVSTHPTWNQGMTQVEAAAKVAEARVEAARPTAEKTVADVETAIPAVEGDVKPVVSDLEKLAQEAEGK